MTTYKLTPTWQVISTTNCLIQAEGTEQVRLYYGDAEPASFYDAFTMPDRIEPRWWPAPGSGSIYAAVMTGTAILRVAEEL